MITLEGMQSSYYKEAVWFLYKYSHIFLSISCFEALTGQKGDKNEI